MRAALVFFAWIKSQQGATAIEYGLIMAAIAVTISVAVFTLGDQIGVNFSNSSALVSQRP